MARANPSNKGRIHLRRPTGHLHFSLAEWRRTIHLLRRQTPLSRRSVVYFCSGAYNRISSDDCARGRVLANLLSGACAAIDLSNCASRTRLYEIG
jgi:hypothetical protein